jgi:hypothetical protein
MLPFGYEIGTGKICDRHGNLSAQTDLIVYHSGVLPPVIFSTSRSTGIFPIESVLYSIEIKSTITAREITDTIRKGRLLSLLDYEGKVRETLKHRTFVANTLFAFGSDLQKDTSLESVFHEFVRYTKHDEDWKTDPVVQAVCIVNRGYFYFHYKTGLWELHQATAEHDEVIDFVGQIGNTITVANVPFRYGRLGNYVQTGRQVHSYNPDHHKAD